MEETTLAKDSRTVPGVPSDTPAATRAVAPATQAVPPHSTSIKLPELDGPVEGIEITRLPWGYAVTRTPRTS
ncbi:hypothetical protein [Pseudomonas oryzihabitans]|uniref:hypothetical protein n=1 Tax=Pseudomonas oryzihabitans TaxID=47885 RepID=UPI002895A745|nr:hypothetical protein [Pseudomonas oryzihabitans]MDT3721087.1 hypothetical protein [Pseudomonas oryzihabitans]